MTQTFFSVDVETTSTNPFTGQLLTIGIIPMTGDDLEIHEGIHIPIEYDPAGRIDESTFNWWKEVPSEEVFNAAWGMEQKRFTNLEAAEMITDFVDKFSPELHDHVFCANPVSFDHPWILKLFALAGVPMPFSHRTVCMRSMLYGLFGGVWGANRQGANYHAPARPHHAYDDAYAQALDLKEIFTNIRDRDQSKKIAQQPVQDSRNIADQLRLDV